MAEHFVDITDRYDFQPLFDIVRDLGEVLLVLDRDQNLADATAQGGEQLFLKPADGQNLAAQGDFAGHGNGVAHRHTGQHGDDRSHHGDTRRGAVLGRSALGDVDVDIALGEQVGLDAKVCRTGLDEALCGLDRLFHHVAQLAGEDRPALAVDGDRFDLQQVAADFGPGQTGYRADLIVFLSEAVAELPHPGEIANVLIGDGKGAVALLHVDRLDRLPAQVGDFTLEVTHTGFAGVVAAQVAQG